jgi:hypothetical protein
MNRGGSQRASNQCPKCRQNTLIFNTHYPVLTATTVLARTGTDPHDGPDRLRYESGWVCENPRCDYHREIQEGRNR